MTKWVMEHLDFDARMRLYQAIHETEFRAVFQAHRRDNAGLRARQQKREHIARTEYICGSEPFEFSRRTPSHAHRVSMNRVESAIAEYYDLDCYKLSI